MASCPSANVNGSQKIARSDVAAAFGPRFLQSGFDCSVNFGTPTLAPGAYDLVAYMFSSRTRQYSPPTVVRFTVQ